MTGIACLGVSCPNKHREQAEKDVWMLAGTVRCLHS